MTDNYQQCLKDISKAYLDILCPNVIRFETLKNQFPVGVLNEIRAAFTHLAKAIDDRYIDQRERELSKVDGHIKRAIRDCYKYNCVAFEDKYIEFQNKGLKDIYSKSQLIEIENNHNNAVNHLILARNYEISLSNDNEHSVNNKEYNEYEQAISFFERMYTIMRGNALETK